MKKPLGKAVKNSKHIKNILAIIMLGEIGNNNNLLSCRTKCHFIDLLYITADFYSSVLNSVI